MYRYCTAFLSLILFTIATAGIGGFGYSAPPASDGQSAAISQPVKVFILLGQSNMVGAGKVKGDGEGSLTYAVRTKGKYAYLMDNQGAWTVRNDVRYVRVMGSGTGPMRLFNNEWLTVSGDRIGPEIGIGHVLGDALDAPVLLLKSCIGNRSLGWDLLPPGSERYEMEIKDPKTGEVKTWVYAGYKDSPAKWEKGTTPQPIGWYAGMQYDGDVANAKKVLAELPKYYPGASRYEIAGFFWWQGDKDRYDFGHAARYEKNLVHLIKQLRKAFDAPQAKFVLATLGQTKKGDGGNDGLILDAQLAVDGESGKYPEFKGNVATVYTHPLSHGGASNSHYNGHAETYMDVGEAMGQAMVKLLRGAVE
ncbi:MAG: sialate O-acetylesterase [Thermogutta sp.]